MRRFAANYRYKPSLHVFHSMPATLNQQPIKVASETCNIHLCNYAILYILAFLHYTPNRPVWSNTSHRRRHWRSQDRTKGNRPHETHFHPVVGSHSWKASLQGKFWCLRYAAHCIPNEIDPWQSSETTPGVNQVSGYGDVSASKSLW